MAVESQIELRFALYDALLRSWTMTITICNKNQSIFPSIMRVCEKTLEITFLYNIYIGQFLSDSNINYHIHNHAKYMYIRFLIMVCFNFNMIITASS